MLYFVVRTDISKHDGSQRVFEACDTKEEAEEFIETRLSHMKGEFKLFLGEQLEEESK